MTSTCASQLNELNRVPKCVKRTESEELDKEVTSTVTTGRCHNQILTSPNTVTTG